MKQKKSLVSNKLFLVILIICGVVLGILQFNNWQKRRSIEREVNTITEETKQYQEKNKELANSLAFLHSSASREQIARQQLNMKKEGEIVVNFPDTLPITSENKAQKTISNPEKWWNYFFGR